MLEGAERRTSMCQDFYRTFYIREGYIVPVSSNFLTQISCGIITKCRKTRAMQRDFTIVDSLALRQCNTSMIPDTHSLKLLFPTRYTSRSINLLSYQSASFCRLISWMHFSTIYYIYMLSVTCYLCDAYSPLPFYKIQKSLYNGRIFAKIK